MKNKMIKELLFLIIPLLLAIPLMITEMIMMIGNLHVDNIIYDWIAFLFASVVIFVFGYAYYKYCFLEIFKWKQLGMNTLITLGVFSGYLYSVYLLIYKTVVFVNNQKVLNIMSFFEVSATIIAIVNVGEYISLKIKNKSNQDINNLSKLLIPTANLYDQKTGDYKEVKTDSLQVNDFVYVLKGTKIPIDGIIYNNAIEVDESLLTGEVNAVYKNVGDKVIGGSINLSNDFVLKVTTTNNNSVINSIIENVKKIDEQKNKTQKVIDKVAKWFTPIIIFCAVLAFLLQIIAPNLLSFSNNLGFFGNINLDWINGDNEIAVRAQKGLYFFIATLTISCPCALGIAAPLANIIGVSKGAKNGILFNNATIFEKINKLNMVVFDKTGTLTTGKLKVDKVIGDLKNLSIIYQMQKISFHPLAKAFVKYYLENNQEHSKIENCKYLEIPGVGIKDDKNNYLICSYYYAKKNMFEISSLILDKFNEYNNSLNEDNLQTISVFVKNNQIVNFIYYSDEIRVDAIKVINKFKASKIDVAILTGDSQKNADYVAKKLNINLVYANCCPSDKKQIIERLQQDKKVVGYIGDGINDLEALKQADFSFSITNENEIAKSVSDVNLIYLNISNVYNAIRIAKQTRINIITNLIWAFGYNVIAVPLAILGFIPAIIGVYIMMVSDVTVNLNSLIFKTIS